MTLPAVREYRTLMDRYQPMPPADLMQSGYRPLPHSFVAFEGFLSAKVLVEVLKQVGSDLDPRKIRQAAESLAQVDLGIDVAASFGPGRHQGLDRVYYTTVADGRFVNLVDWSRWRR